MLQSPGNIDDPSTQPPPQIELCPLPDLKTKSKSAVRDHRPRRNYAVGQPAVTWRENAAAYDEVSRCIHGARAQFQVGRQARLDYRLVIGLL